MLTPISVLLTTLAALAGLAALVYTWQRRAAPAAQALAWYLWAALAFLVFTWIQRADHSSAGTYLWRQLQWMCAAALPTLWWMFALRYTGNPTGTLLTRLLWLEPLLMMALLAGNPQYGVLWQMGAQLPVVYGPGFWVHLGYALVLYLGGVAWIAAHYQAAHPFYRQQALWVVSGALFPVAVTGLALFARVPGLALDAIPPALALGGAALARGIARFHRLPLLPVARATLIDTMPDGLLVLDAALKLIDLNPAARVLLRLDPRRQVLGLPLVEIWPPSAGWPPEPLRWPQVIHQDGRALALRLAALGERRKQHGWLVVLADVTRQVQAEAALEHANAALVSSNATLRQMNTDLEARIAVRTMALSRRAQELEAISRVSTALRRAVGLDELLQILLHETSAIFEAAAGYVLLLEEDELLVAAARAVDGLAAGAPGPGDRLAACRDPLWNVVDTGQALQLPADSEGASELFQRMALPGGEVAILPIRAANRILGLLVMAFPRPLGEQFLNFAPPLTAIAEMAGNALQRVRTVENLEALVQARTRDLSALYEVTAAINQPLALGEICRRVLEILQDVLDLPAAAIYLRGEDDPQLRQELALGGPFDLPLPANLPELVLAREGVVVLPVLESPPSGLTAGVGVPVGTKGRLVGALVAYSEEIGRFSAEDIALLAAAGDHLGGAIERFRLRRRAEQAAVMEERNRLARDLHDSVTQSLYSLVLFGEAGFDALSAGQPDKTAGYLQRLRDTAQQALKEMRLLIYELRPQALQSEGLVGALKRRLETVEQRAGITATIEVDQQAPLPERVEAGLYGIAQEALNNIIKHARATRVLVRLCAGPRQATLEICDNGQGLNSNGAGGIGLASMRERALSLGGALTVENIAGGGLRVLASIPIEET